MIPAALAGAVLAAMSGGGLAMGTVPDAPQAMGARASAAAPVVADVSGITVYRSSGVTSLSLTNGTRVHLKVMPANAGSGGAGAAAGARQGGNRVSVHAFVPVRQGLTASGHALGHEVGMLAAAILGEVPQAGDAGAGSQSPVEAGGAGAGTPTADRAAVPAARRFGRACWLGADGLHVRLSGEPAELPQLLERLGDILTAERVDPAIFATVHERELRRLGEGVGADREVVDVVLSAVNPGYRRPDATVMATVTMEEVEQWLTATLGAAAKTGAEIGAGLVVDGTPGAGEPAEAAGKAAGLAPPLDVAIAGPIEMTSVARLAAEALGDLPARAVGAGFTRGTLVRPGLIVSERPSASDKVWVEMAWEAPPLHEIASYRASLAAMRLVQQRLRDGVGARLRSGLGVEKIEGAQNGNWPGKVEVLCRVMPGPDRLPSLATMRVSVGEWEGAAGLEELAGLMAAELEALAGRGERGRPATDAEADGATDALVVDAGRFLASSDYWASVLATHRQVGLDPDDLVTAPKAYDAFTGADLTRAAGDLLDRGQRLRVVRGPR